MNPRFELRTEKLEKAGGNGIPLAVVISLRPGAVVEKGAFVAVRVGMRAIGTGEGNGRGQSIFRDAFRSP